MSKPQMQDLTGKLVVAMPTLDDEHFKRSVNLVIEHNDTDGAIALNLSMLSDIDTEHLLQSYDIHSNGDESELNILCGGPVQPEQGFLVFATENWHEKFDSSIIFSNTEIVVSAKPEILKQVIEQFPRSQYAIVHGYAGWSAGQLEQEIAENSWLICDYPSPFFFATDSTNRWQTAAESIGIKIANLSNDIGHA